MMSPGLPFLVGDLALCEEFDRTSGQLDDIVRSIHVPSAAPRFAAPGWGAEPASAVTSGASCTTCLDMAQLIPAQAQRSTVVGWGDGYLASVVQLQGTCQQQAEECSLTSSIARRDGEPHVSQQQQSITASFASSRSQATVTKVQYLQALQEALAEYLPVTATPKNTTGIGTAVHIPETLDRARPSKIATWIDGFVKRRLTSINLGDTAKEYYYYSAGWQAYTRAPQAHSQRQLQLCLEHFQNLLTVLEEECRALSTAFLQVLVRGCIELVAASGTSGASSSAVTAKLRWAITEEEAVLRLATIVNKFEGARRYVSKQFAEVCQRMCAQQRIVENKERPRLSQDNAESHHVQCVLRDWLLDNFDNPYPTEEQRQELCRRTGLMREQVRIWLSNTRLRVWKPLLKEVCGLTEEELGGSDGTVTASTQEVLPCVQPLAQSGLSPLSRNRRTCALPPGSYSGGVDTPDEGTNTKWDDTDVPHSLARQAQDRFSGAISLKAAVRNKRSSQRRLQM
eukprot:jgi/Chlat1/666/Chrsp104S01145